MMADEHLLRSSTFEGWHQFICLPSDRHIHIGYTGLQGHLSDNGQVEAILQYFLLFGPQTLLLVAAPIKFVQLHRARLVTVPNYRGLVKVFVSSTLFTLQLVYIITVLVASASTKLLATHLLSLVASAALCVLSFLEHGRSVAPSTLLTVYLVLSTFADVVRVGLLYVAKNLCGSSSLAFAIFAVKLALLVLEAQSKTLILRERYQHLAPDETAGFFGTAFYWWVNDIITLGHSKILSVQDLPPLASHLDAMRMREAMQRTWDMRRRPEHRFSLLFAHFRCLWRPILQCMIPRALLTAFRYCQPLLISRTIAYVSSELPPLENRNEAFRLILFTFLIYTGMAVSKGVCDFHLSRVAIMNRMTMVGLIHNRCLTIQDGVFDESAAVTLMSNDAENIMVTADVFNELWAQALEVCVGMYLLATELGWVSIVPLLLVIITSQGGRFATAHIASRQKAIGMATQTRISVTKAILDSMKNIKMMGLVEKMEAKVQAARNHEINMYISFGWLILAFNTSVNMLTIFSPVVTLIIYAVQAELRGAKSIDVNTAFTSLAIIGMVTVPANAFLTFMAHMAAYIAVYDRIQKYLTSADRQDKREIFDKKCANGPDGHGDHGNENGPTNPRDGSVVQTVDGDNDDLAISISNATIRPAPVASPVLHEINTIVKKGSLVVCSGAVATGKTTLAKALLGDLPPDTGTIKTAFGTIAYCSQTAWLINGTVRDIIRGPPGDESGVDETWYRRILHVCDLEEDLHQLPDGDQTIVGSRGITLSGGQKQRVALARAVYARRDMIILDDVLSALDASTEHHIVDNLIGPKGLFKELSTTVLLITHATQYLPLADHIIILGDDGKIVKQGAWDDIQTNVDYINQVVLRETRDDSQRSRDSTESRNEMMIPTLATKKPDEKLQDLTRKTGDVALYSYYFAAIGWSRILALLASMMSYATFLGLTPYWLRWWAEGSEQDLWYYSGIYFLLTLGAFISMTAVTANIFLVIGPRSGNTLHARLLHTVMAAPQSYFAETDTGTTLNRFSADTQMIDRMLAPFMMHVGLYLFQLLSQCILLGVVQPLMALTLPLTLIVVYLIQKLYLITSRQLRFLDLEIKALVNASFLETLEGVPTIRAFGWQRAFVKDNVRKLDLSMRPQYLILALQRWLATVMDLTVLGMAMFVISLAVGFKGTTTGGQIGIALNVVLQAHVVLLRLVESWATMESSMGAISRLRTFEKDVQPEDKPGETHRPPLDWPARGAIAFDHMSAAYNPATLALRDVSISIEPGKKVGVCGRTGSGKSSLMLSLLRLVEMESGTIRIDDLDVQTLPRNAIRSRLITVPQDPMLVMTDTVRQNLDVADAAVSDEDIIRVLKRVKLWSVLQSRATGAETVGRQARELDVAMGGDGGGSENRGSSVRDSRVAMPLSSSEDPDASPAASLNVIMKSLPLSHGQQQLFSLARAMLMRPTRGKIVLLDEATSNVDGDTDKLMQRLIREEFKEHTIVTVAHRLDTIMDSDVVLVLKDGMLVEVGAPSDLVQRESGIFRTLYGKRQST